MQNDKLIDWLSGSEVEDFSDSDSLSQVAKKMSVFIRQSLLVVHQDMAPMREQVNKLTASVNLMHAKLENIEDSTAETAVSKYRVAQIENTLKSLKEEIRDNNKWAFRLAVSSIVGALFAIAIVMMRTGLLK